MAKIGGLVGKGAGQLGVSGRNSNVSMDGECRSALMSS